MSATDGAYTQDNRIGQLSTQLGKDVLLLMGMTCTERLSESYTVTVDAFSQSAQPVHTLLGTAIGVKYEAAGDSNVNRAFAGVLWEYSELGEDERGHRYRLTLRPQAAFMTLNKRNRIFQNKSVVDIVKSLLIGNFEVKLNGAYDPLEYCVQYQESDFDFASRLMEFEGIYYYYEHDGTTSKIVLVDDGNAHVDMAPATAKVLPRSDRRPDAPIWSVTERRSLAPTKVTVDDYDFEAPTTALLKTKAAAKVVGAPTDRGSQSDEGAGGSWSGTAEVYDFPAKFGSTSTATGQRYSANWLDAHRRRMARSFADGGLFAAAAGRRLTLTFEDATTTEYLIVGTSHDYVAPGYESGEGEETFLCSLELMPAADQYRPAHVTPRPRILGPQTAIVVGPSGEEIYTDKYGRIKVQFFWDREGKKDENSSCFIRVLQSTAGQSWGSFSLPRIGQEVVVEFLDGDPDRPIVTGAVYNASNTTPVALPDNKTQFGLRTRITKGGGGFSHYWFEDKKGEEVVWFRAERDYKAHIVNKDEERQYDKGSRTTLFKEGNDELTISKGTRTETIQSHDKKTIKEGDLTDVVELGSEIHTVKTGKRTTTINDDETLEVKMGNRSTTIKMGNESLKVSLGNVDIKVDLGKHATEAMQSIELTCGPSKFKMDPMSISLEAMTIKLDAKLMLQTKGLMVQQEASAIHIVKGGLVMIN
ncbi:type VI secretion system Vgr family protein [Sphingomonas sp.]|uniref:type VI secretion system Vgr family protein n=1 Tax=Sphingomonas sp. TaxID=28214 RepID=UPI0035BC0350